MKLVSTIILTLAVINLAHAKDDYSDWVINPETTEPEALCDKYSKKALSKSRPDLRVIKINYAAQVPVYVISSKITHGFACGFKVVTDKNKIGDLRIEIDAKTGQSQMKTE